MRKVTRQMSYCLDGDTLDLGQGPTTAWEEGDGWVNLAVETPIAGGTGRFVGASGTLDETVRVTPSWWPPGFYTGTADWLGPWTREVSLTYTRDSYISYDASNRAAN